jgi:hypothetical protein
MIYVTNRIYLDLFISVLYQLLELISTEMPNVVCYILEKHDNKTNV